MFSTQDMDKLTSVFRNVFDDDELIITPETVADDVDGWDSLAHIRLIVSIEGAFGVKFAAAEVDALKNVGDLIKLLRSKKS